MAKINFTKMVASGNDFVVVEKRDKGPIRLARFDYAHHKLLAGGRQGYRLLAKKICDRKFGVGADGLLLLEESRKADVRMRIFNADGSEAEMCGNGARATALYVSRDRESTGYKSQVSSHKKSFLIETMAGIIDSEVVGDNVKIKLTDPKDVRLDIPIKVNNRDIKVNFINTGVPHAVVFACGLNEIDIVPLGRAIRYHKNFSPKGTNVNFVEVLSKNKVTVRTYERGVEDETLACGTGSVASALIYALKIGMINKVYVRTRSTEILTVYFRCDNKEVKDVWLEGKANVSFKGEGDF